jgi:hypothetical protein
VGAWRWLGRRLTPAALAYIAAVTVLAAVGFAAGRPLLIVVAAVVTLPVSIVAVPALYMLAGVLGIVPGANPSHASGTGYVSARGVEVVTESGEPATWYLVSIGVAGALLLGLAALGNVLLLGLVIRWGRRAHVGA